MLTSNQMFATSLVSYITARANADITGEREIIQQLGVDTEGVENGEDGYKSDLPLDFHQ